MKRFVFEIIILILVLGLVFTLWIFYYSHKIHQTDNYLLEQQEKEELVKQTKGERRLILLGGSNVAFGVNSQMLQDSLNIRVINYGLHAGMGFRLPMKRLHNYLTPNDLIICMPEYDVFFGDGYDGERSTLPYVFLSQPAIITNLNFNQIEKSIIGLKSIWIELNNYKTPNHEDNLFLYSKWGFNEFGDEVSHLKKRPRVKNVLSKCLINQDLNIRSLNDFINRLDNWSNKGIKTIMLTPCLYDSSYYYNENEAKINYLSNLLAEKGYPYICTPKESLFDSTYMYDTHYHLNSHGRELNSQRILNCLKPLF